MKKRKNEFQVQKMSKAEAQRIKRLEKQRPRTQKSLFFDDLDVNGLLHVEKDLYSYTFELGSITYSTATDKEKKTILTAYNTAINTLSEIEHFQLTAIVSRVTEQQYQQKSLFPYVNDGKDGLRKTFNNIMEESYKKGHNNFNVAQYITLSTHASSEEGVIRRLENISSDFDDELRQVKVPFDQLDGLSRLKVINRILRPGIPLYGNFRDISLSRLTPKDLVAPQYLKFGHSSFEIDNMVGEVRFLRDYPQNLKDTLFKDLTEAEVEMVITIQGQPYSSVETNTKLNNQYTDVEGDEIKQEKRNNQHLINASHISRTTRENKKELSEKIDFIRNTDDKELSATFLILLLAKDKTELQENWAKIDSVGAKHGAHFYPLYLAQEEGLNSSLPLGRNYADVEKTYTRDLVASNISVNSPWTSVDVQHEHGRYYGTNQLSKNNILIDRKDSSMLNGNGGVIAISGGGKSFASKCEMLLTLLTLRRDEVIVLDVEQEYIPLAEAFNGQVISIGPGSPTTLNILDLPDASTLREGDNPISLKSSFLLGLFSMLLSGLTPAQKSIIDSVTTRTYKEYPRPSLQEWYKVLRDDKTSVAQQLADDLALYITGSLNMFAKQTNIEQNNRFTVYDIHNLKNESKLLGYMTVLDRIQNKVIENRKKGISTWVYLDELATVINPSQPQILRELVADIYSRFRKYDGYPTFMTQFAETMLSTFEGRSILGNTNFLILLEQNSTVLDLVVEKYKLTPKEEGYLDHPGVGKGLIIAGKNKIPFSNIIPEDTDLYRLIDTKPRESING